MRKVFLLALIMALCILNALYADSDITTTQNTNTNTDTQNPPTITDIGNSICPIDGKEVDGKTTYIYHWKRYNLCSPQCKAAFKAEPEKYAAVADKEASEKK